MVKTSVYKCKDGRMRIYIKDENGRRVISYPKYIMEQYLGRKLLPDEQVHHIDGDFTNNEIENLKVMTFKEHNRLHSDENIKYFDKIAICDVCGKEFLWTGKRQRKYFIDINGGKKRIVSCSKSCSSFYGRQTQLKREHKQR